MHTDREPEVPGARITIQGTFPPEELFPAFVCCFPGSVTLICPKDTRNAHFVVRDGLLHQQGTVGEEFLCCTDRFRREGQRFNPLLPNSLRESAVMDEESARAQVRSFPDSGRVGIWRKDIGYTKGREQDKAFSPNHICDGRGCISPGGRGVLQRGSPCGTANHCNLIGGTWMVRE